MNRWNHKSLMYLRERAAAGDYASVIAVALGTSHASILTMAGRHGIAIAKWSPQQQAEFDRRARARDAEKKAKKRKLKRAVLLANLGPSKTSPVYRNQLPRMPEMTKGQLRAFLGTAVRNTAAMAEG